MRTKVPVTLCVLCLVLLSVVSGETKHREDQVTILYDVFGKSGKMQRDWGFSALIEYSGKRILFDTGNNAKIFADNVRTLGVDLRTLDFAVISHRHLDHTAGLTYLQEVNPGVKVYAPLGIAGIFGSFIPSDFYRKDATLPAHMKFFDGNPPDRISLGEAWTKARFETLANTKEIIPGFHLIALVSDQVGVKEMRELSLAIQTEKGILLVVGCSHPGLENIVGAAQKIDSRLYMIFGGFHLPSASDEGISRIAATLSKKFGVKYLAPGHCTGEPAMALFRKTWGKDYLYAGLGAVVKLP